MRFFSLSRFPTTVSRFARKAHLVVTATTVTTSATAIFAGMLVVAGAGCSEKKTPDVALKTESKADSKTETKPTTKTETKPEIKTETKTEKPVEDAVSQEIPSIHQFTVNTLEGKPQSLADFKGKTVLLVNTASECGYTPQYTELEKLYKQYKDKNFVVLGFPSNDFGGQEPGTSEEIRKFITDEYGITFPMFSKVVTKGGEQAPIYKMLTQDGPENTHGDIKWNFTKFLIGPDGQIIDRFGSNVDPMSKEVIAAVESHLPK